VCRKYERGGWTILENSCGVRGGRPCCNERRVGRVADVASKRKSEKITKRKGSSLKQNGFNRLLSKETVTEKGWGLESPTKENGEVLNANCAGKKRGIKYHLTI